MHRKACCFDVCIPKVWIQSICQCGVISNGIYKACIEFRAHRLKHVVLTTCPLSLNIYYNSVTNCLITSRTSVHRCYSVGRQVVQTWSWHVTSKQWVYKCMNQIVLFTNIAILQNQLDKYTPAQMTWCYTSLPQPVPIHCYNLDRMPVDMFYMACFTTNFRDICNNCSEFIIEIGNINFYIHTEALVLHVHVCYSYLLAIFWAMNQRIYTIGTLSFPTQMQNFLMTSCIQTPRATAGSAWKQSGVLPLLDSPVQTLLSFPDSHVYDRPILCMGNSNVHVGDCSEFLRFSLLVTPTETSHLRDISVRSRSCM